MRNGKAETIEEAILNYLQTNSLNISKLCAFGSDVWLYEMECLLG